MTNKKKSNATCVQENQPTQNLFRPEYIEFAEQLAKMSKWVLDYRETVDKREDHILVSLGGLEGAFDEAIFHVGELVASDFKENGYYNRRDQDERVD